MDSTGCLVLGGVEVQWGRGWGQARGKVSGSKVQEFWE